MRIIGAAAAIAATVLATLTAAETGPARAGDDAPDYLDDRSTPEAVIRSYFNAVALGHVARAMSYAADGVEMPDIETFRTQIAEIEVGELRLGEAAAETADGLTSWRVPTALEIVAGGERHVQAGCIVVVLTDPAAQQELPYRPIAIANVDLNVTGPDFAQAPAACPDG